MPSQKCKCIFYVNEPSCIPPYSNINRRNSHNNLVERTFFTNQSNIFPWVLQTIQSIECPMGVTTINVGFTQINPLHLRWALQTEPIGIGSLTTGESFAVSLYDLA